jgi:hypothetical protein
MKFEVPKIVVGLVCVLAAVVGTGAIFGLSEKSRSDDRRLGRELQRGGLIVLLRHAPAETSVRATPGCAGQANLTSEGRADARAIGAGFAGADVSVHSLLVSPLCRAQDTARLAFPAVSASVVTALALNAHDGANARDRKLREVRQLLSQRPPPGTDRVLITHSDVIKATTGEDVSEGDGLVLRPFGDGRFKVLDHINPGDLK